MKRVLLTFLLLLTMPFAASYAQDGQSSGKKNLVVKEWNTSVGGLAGTLDHVTIYSAEGKKVEEIEYDNAGKQKWRKRYEWGDGDFMKCELVYDRRNQLVNCKKFEYNEFGKKKAQYTYDANGKLISTKIIEYIAEDASKF